MHHIYYRNGPARAVAAVDDAEPWERSALRALYPGDVELWAYAIRDTDGERAGWAAIFGR